MTNAASLTTLVRAELTNEFARKASLEQRGLAVITSSGTLVTLLFAIGAVAGGGPLADNASTRNALLAALFGFIAAAISGIVVNWPWHTEAIPVDAPDGLRDLIKPATFFSEDQEVDRRIAEVQVRQIVGLRRVNGWKAFALLAGLSLEVLAVLGVAAVVTMRVT